MRLSIATAALIATTSPAAACDLALLLAVDVSGSVDHVEYDIQMRGLAAGLRDGAVSEALVRAQAQVGLIQWTGSSRQHFSLPWTQVQTFDDAEALAARIETMPRHWRNYATAVGEAGQYAMDRMAEVPGCKRKVIDISGDGISNEGIEPAQLKPALTAAGISVNALAIEGAEEDLTGYFWENVIHGPGAFVVTADGFREFAEKMRQKLRREVTLQVSSLPPG